MKTSLGLLVSFVGFAGVVAAADAPPPPPPIPHPTAPVIAQPVAIPTQVVAAPATNAPRIQFASTTVDFGKVNSGASAKCDFYFTNTGLSTLEILDVRPGCGCTTAGTWDRKVEPGKTGLIPLQLNTAGFGGMVMKTATVTCNDPTQQTVSLQLKGEIWKPVDVQPTFVVFSPANPATNEVRVARVVNNTDEPMTISDLKSSAPTFKAELKELKPNKEFEIRIETVPPLQVGNPQAVITAKTTSTNLPNLSITAMAIVQAPVVALPQQLVLQPGPLAAPGLYNVSVRNNAPGTPVAVTNATVNLTNVTVKISETQPGVFFNLALSFPEGFQLQPGQRGELVVNTTHPQVQNITVPILQMPKPVTPPMQPTAAPGQPAHALRPPPPPPSIAAPTAPVPPRPTPAHQ